MIIGGVDVEDKYSIEQTESELPFMSLISSNVSSATSFTINLFTTFIVGLVALGPV